MIVAIVNFPLPDTMTRAEYTAGMLQTVPRYRGTIGLIRKNYVYDGEHHVGGAAYVFDSLEHAKACFSEDFIKRVAAGYGAPNIRFFDSPISIDNESKTVSEYSE
jgi:hypothetical protein